MLFKYSIPSYHATQGHCKRCWSLLWGSRNGFCISPINSTIFLPYTPADPWWSNVHVTQFILEFLIESIFTHPAHTGLHGHAYKFHQQRYCTHRRKYPFSIRAIPFLSKLPAEIVNAPSVKSVKTLLGTNYLSLFPEINVKSTSSYNPFPLHSWPHLETHIYITLFTVHSRWSVIVVITAH